MLDRPTQFGPYMLLERISLGGMAEVFKAVEYGVEGFERIVAVKRILPHVAEDEQFIAMFKDEAHIAVQLTHSNIAQIYSLGSEQENFYIALEYVAGRDVRTLFEHGRRAGAPMPTGQACYIVMQVCEGLDYAHNKRDKYGRSLNIIHRDVSPPNILVSYEGEVKLIDFGVAKAAGRVSKTQAGILKGKFGYMSPEQVKGESVDRRSDVFALAVVLWEILTGRRLFQGETDFATLDKIRAAEIETPSSYCEDIPPALEAIVMKGLAVDPKTRYQSAMELHDALQGFIYSSGTMFGRKELAGWMRTEFAREIELEKEKASKRAAAASQDAAAPAEDSAAEAVSTAPAKASKAPPRKGPPTPPKRSGGPPSPPKRSGGGPPAPPGRTGKRTKTMVMTSTKAKVPTGGPPKPPGKAKARSAPLPPPKSAAAAKAAKPEAAKGTSGPGSDFDWDDEELETRLFDEVDLPDATTKTPDVSSAPTSKKPGAPRPPAKKARTASATLPPPKSAGGAGGKGGKVNEDKRKSGGDTKKEVAAASATASKAGPPAPPKPVTKTTPPASSSAAAPAASVASGGSLPTAPLVVEEVPSSSRGKTIGMGLALIVVMVVLISWVTGGSEPSPSQADSVAAGDPVASAAGSLGGMSLSLQAADAVVKVDGVEVSGTGTTRVIGELAAGSHELEVTASGYLPFKTSVDVVAGLAPSIPVKLQPVTVDVVVNVSPSNAALVLVSGATRSPITSPHQLTRAPGTTYAIEASASGHLPKTVTLEFDDQKVLNTVIALEADPEAKAAAATKTIKATKSRTATAKAGTRSSETKPAGSSTAGRTGELIIGGMFPGQPPATIVVDGKSYGAKPRVVAKVSAGTHNIKWKWSDGKVSTTSVKVSAGGSTKVKAKR